MARSHKVAYTIRYPVTNQWFADNKMSLKCRFQHRYCVYFDINIVSHHVLLGIVPCKVIHNAECDNMTYGNVWEVIEVEWRHMRSCMVVNETNIFEYMAEPSSVILCTAMYAQIWIWRALSWNRPYIDIYDHRYNNIPSHKWHVEIDFDIEILCRFDGKSISSRHQWWDRCHIETNWWSFDYRCRFDIDFSVRYPSKRHKISISKSSSTCYL